jgi:hypothetical protein
MVTHGEQRVVQPDKGEHDEGFLGQQGKRLRRTIMSLP